MEDLSLQPKKRSIGGMAKRATEIKVGLLVLLSGAILAGFVFILGNFSTQKGFTFYVDFNFVGNLAKGAPVKVSGIKVGKIQEIRFLAGTYDPKVKRRVYVRLKVWVEDRARKAIRTDSEFYINTEGVLGEQYLEITPGSVGDAKHPALKDGQVVAGKAPPRADLIVARLYSFLDVVTKLLDKEKDHIGEALTSATSALRTANDILTENRQSIKTLFAKSESLATEAEGLAKSLHHGIGDGGRIRRVLTRTDKAVGTVARRLDSTFDKVDGTLDEVDRLAKLVGPKERDKVLTVLDKVLALTRKADRIANETLALVRRVRKGKGTAGALVMDREVYEDLRELIKDLRRNPWKFFWKE